MSREGFQFQNITAIGTTNLITGRKGFFKGVAVNSAFTGTVRMYDSSSTAPAGTTPTDMIIATIGTPNVTPTFIAYNARVKNGLVAAATGTPSVTIVYE